MSVRRSARPTVKAPPTALDRECRDIFNLVSADGGRTIAVSELDAALCLLGVKSPGPAELEALLLELDPHWRNEISFSRFRAAVRRIDAGGGGAAPTTAAASRPPSPPRAATAPAGVAKESVGTLLTGSTKRRWRMPTLGWAVGAPRKREAEGARLTTTDAVTDAWQLRCQSKLALSAPGAHAVSDELGLRSDRGVLQAKPVHVHNLKQATAHVFAHADSGTEAGCCIPWTTAE